MPKYSIQLGPKIEGKAYRYVRVLKIKHISTKPDALSWGITGFRGWVHAVCLFDSNGNALVGDQSDFTWAKQWKHKFYNDLNTLHEENLKWLI